MSHIVYVFVNSDLKMSKGKIASQVGHACEMLSEAMSTLIGMAPKSDIATKINLYRKDGRKKVIVQASLEQLKELIKLEEIVYVVDAGKTEIPQGSLTAVAHLPIEENDEKFKGYKLL